MRKNLKKILIIISLCLLAAALTAGALLYFGVIHLNSPSREVYPVVGVDVSHHQGKIDWDVLSSQGIDFAYIKATEGSSFVDPRFEENFRNAKASPLRVGVYHFFSFDSTGEEQAEHFRRAVEPYEGMLPPAVDVEYYGDYASGKPVDSAKVKAELRKLVDALTEEYGMKPVVYAADDSYAAFVKGDFDDCALWYRSVYSGVGDGIGWTFWQYSNRHVLDGYEGGERYIDMNVFAGDKNSFMKYPDR